MEYVEELQVDKSVSTNNTATFINAKPKPKVPEISTSIPKFSRAAPRDWEQLERPEAPTSGRNQD